MVLLKYGPHSRPFFDLFRCNYTFEIQWNINSSFASNAKSLFTQLITLLLSYHDFLRPSTRPKVATIRPSDKLLRQISTLNNFYLHSLKWRSTSSFSLWLSSSDSKLARGSKYEVEVILSEPSSKNWLPRCRSR